MFDLIKITSRKQTTKIITFYYRIPKFEDYDQNILEPPDMLNRFDKKPNTRYQFAFRRNEFEEVSMSFEFEKEDGAKQCIQSVSTLYKKLKDHQKRSQRKTAQSGTLLKQGPATSNAQAQS